MIFGALLENAIKNSCKKIWWGMEKGVTLHSLSGKSRSKRRTLT